MSVKGKGDARSSDQHLRGLNQTGQTSRISQREPRRPAIEPGGDQSTVPKAGQVLAHRGLRQVHVIDHISDPVLTATQMFEDRQPCRFCQSVKQCGIATAILKLEGVDGRAAKSIYVRHMAMLSQDGDSRLGRPLPGRGLPRQEVTIQPKAVRTLCVPRPEWSARQPIQARQNPSPSRWARSRRARRTAARIARLSDPSRQRAAVAGWAATRPAGLNPKPDQPPIGRSVTLRKLLITS